MINNYLETQIKENFPYEPTFEQEIVLKSLATFLLSPRNDAVFVLRGYAGTGKTSLVGALVRTLDKLQQKSILLAPTGRAAKVFSAYAGHPAFTIHKKIYRQQSFSNEVSNFSVNDNLTTHTLYIVDEASMISNEGLSGAVFGTGRLLDDLIQFVYSGTGCRLVLMGDTAQLPPVGEEQSPALFAEALKGYGLEVIEVDLTQVVRQVQDSGILWNATRLRQLIAEDACESLPKIKVSGFADIKVVPGDELIDTLSTCYDRDGMDETIVVCRSNKRANRFNEGIRRTILYREEDFSSGDRIMIVKNNYFWGTDYDKIDFIANGDIATVRRAGRREELYGLHFVRADLKIDGYEEELSAWVILDTLLSDYPALTYEQSRDLYRRVEADYADVPLKRKRFEKVRTNEYYNALQVKFAYAVTCHKAQGGQWDAVFIDQGWLPDDMPGDEYWRWLYTAVTRARKRLYFINFKEEFFLEE